ncbi:MAG: hypothetical protein AB7V61_15735, partial [Methylocystis sp.]
MVLALAPDLSFAEEAAAGRNDPPQKNSVKTNSTGKRAAGPGAASATPSEKKSYYVPTRGYRLEPQPDIPPYVRNLAKTYK